MSVVELNRWVQQDWMSVAACKGQTQWFFAPHGEQADARERRRAGFEAVEASWIKRFLNFGRA